MEVNLTKLVPGKSLRPVRNRRYSRKSFVTGQRPTKRLFTPEIKRFLKEWLVRRRDNPYPNREEKKVLAVDTGLTYIQICNWFANWRRKLKNAGSERNRKTWGHLIKTYNKQAEGNVEQFSICSDDSIWGEAEPSGALQSGTPREADHCYTPLQQNKLHYTSFISSGESQCYQVSSTTEECKTNTELFANIGGNKYKSHIMKKYLKGLQMDETDAEQATSKSASSTSAPVLLEKWLESAAKFQPRQSNYVTWNSSGFRVADKKFKSHSKGFKSDGNANNDLIHLPGSSGAHGREEVEAAVTLTRLAGLFRSPQ